MKKFLKVFLILCCCAFLAGLVRRMPVVGNEYVVTEVTTRGSFSYKYKYKVDIRCADRNSNKYTFNGNHHRFYTNDLYAIGDTIHIGKK